MAAGTTIMLKRKAGAFTGGQLAAGEVGIDTTNGVIYFSTTGSNAIAIVSGAGDALTSGTLAQFAVSTSATIGVGTIELGHASDTSIGRSAAGRVAVEGVNLVSISSTDTLTNKRFTPRITTITSEGTPTVNTDNCDAVTITAQAAAITSMTTNLTGTPVNFQQLVYRIKDNGTARAITWGASFEACGAALPTTTVLGKRLYVIFLYDTVAAKWGCVSTSQEA